MSSKLEDITKLLDGLQSALNQSTGNSFERIFVFIPWAGRHPSGDELKMMLAMHGMIADEMIVSFHRSPEGRDDIILVSTPGSARKIEGWSWYELKGLTGESGPIRFNASLNKYFAQWQAGVTDIQPEALPPRS
jgi:hypothetical protein